VERRPSAREKLADDAQELAEAVSVGVPTFLVHGDVYFWGSLMVGCFIASVPIAIIYNFFVDRFIAGFTVGAIK